MAINIEYQVVEEPCRDCGAVCDVVRGPVFDAGQGVGLYLALLHGCREGDTVILTIALNRPSGPEAYTLQAWPRDDQVEMYFLDAGDCPWPEEAYLGRLLSAEEARAKPQKALVFEVADLVCDSVPEVSRFLAQPAAG